MSEAAILTANKVYHDTEASSYDDNLPYMKNAFAQAMFDEDIARIIKQLGSASSLHVLDCGAGTGNLTLKFLARGCRVTAVDISGNMLERLRGKVKEADRGRAHIVHTDVDTFLEQTTDRYDVVGSSSFLHHLPDHLATYRRLIGVCREVATIYTAFEPSPVVRRGLAQKTLNALDTGLYEFVRRKYYRPDVLARGLLRRAGLLATPTRSDAQLAVDHGLVERPDLGISAEALAAVLRENRFGDIDVRWRPVKRYRMTYLVDKYFVRSNNALFLVGHRRGHGALAR
jgi:putative AdoMet-dependent methyltransferase